MPQIPPVTPTLTMNVSANDEFVDRVMDNFRRVVHQDRLEALMDRLGPRGEGEPTADQMELMDRFIREEIASGRLNVNQIMRQ